MRVKLGLQKLLWNDESSVPVFQDCWPEYVWHCICCIILLFIGFTGLLSAIVVKRRTRKQVQFYTNSEFYSSKTDVSKYLLDDTLCGLYLPQTELFEN